MRNRQVGLMFGPAILIGLACACGTTPADKLNLSVDQVSRREALSTDSAKFNFESSLQGFAAAASNNSTGNCAGSPSVTLNSLSLVGPTQGIGPVFAGSGSLQLNINKEACQFASAGVTSPPSAGWPAAGAFITFRVWIPAGSPVTDLHPYIKYSPGFGYTDFYINGADGLPADGWVTAVVQVPSTASAITEIGAGINTSSDWVGSIFIDSIDF